MKFSRNYFTFIVALILIKLQVQDEVCSEANKKKSRNLSTVFNDNSLGISGKRTLGGLILDCSLHFDKAIEN